MGLPASVDRFLLRLITDMKTYPYMRFCRNAERSSLSLFWATSISDQICGEMSDMQLTPLGETGTLSVRFLTAFPVHVPNSQ